MSNCGDAVVERSFQLAMNKRITKTTFGMSALFFFKCTEALAQTKACHNHSGHSL